MQYFLYNIKDGEPVGLYDNIVLLAETVSGIIQQQGLGSRHCYVMVCYHGTNMVSSYSGDALADLCQEVLRDQ